MNTNHDPKNGEFAAGPGGAATQHRAAQAAHLKAARAIRRQRLIAKKAAFDAAVARGENPQHGTASIRRQEAGRKGGQAAAGVPKGAAAAAPAKAGAAKADQIAAGHRAVAAGHRDQRDARVKSAQDHRAKADGLEAQARALVAAARNERFAGNKASDLGKEAGAKAGEHSALGKAVPAGAAPAAGNRDDAAREDILRGPISSMHNLPGETDVRTGNQSHVSVVKVAELSSGARGAWKAADGENSQYMRGSAIKPGQQTEREVGAWQVAKAVGMQDLVAPAIERTINGKRGVMMEWQKGKPAMNFSEDVKYDGAEGLGRAAVFDYVVGNTDRHGKNWLVEKQPGKSAKLHLIDHGLSFPESHAGGNRQLLGRAKAGLAGMKTPSAYAANYVGAADRIGATLKALKLPKAAIDGVQSRIAILAKAADWRDLR